LATYRLNRHSTAWKREVQLYDLAQGRFNSQHGCDPGFANVHGMPLQHTARAGIDGDINLNFEAGLATGVGSKRGDCELIVSFPSGFAPLVDPIRQRGYPNNRDYVGLLHTAAFLL
jgi:hypothetical protein